MSDLFDEVHPLKKVSNADLELAITETFKKLTSQDFRVYVKSIEFGGSSEYSLDMHKDVDIRLSASVPINKI